MTETTPRKSDLGVRVVSAVVMVAVAGTALWLGGWIWTAFVGAIAVGVLWEWWGLARQMTERLPARGAWMIGGVIYVGIAASLLAVIGNNNAMGGANPQSVAIGLVAPLILVVVATDVGAYFTGRAVGGAKIAPSISPSKTWAGLFGGMVLASIVLATFAGFGTLRTSWPKAAVVGACLAVAAQAGDFLESWMKRRAGVKDSGKLLPGHGGLLDRVDGLLAVANLVAVVSVFALAGSSDL